jgi:hypothetical protein
MTWCEVCLDIRVGQVVEQLPADWKCPVCLGFCNCSSPSCQRAKAGWMVTGLMHYEALPRGHRSVAHYLMCTAAASDVPEHMLLPGFVPKRVRGRAVDSNHSHALRRSQELVSQPTGLLFGTSLQHRRLKSKDDEFQRRLKRLLKPASNSLLLGAHAAAGGGGATAPPAAVCAADGALLAVLAQRRL